jgi:hypothetical protein
MLSSSVEEIKRRIALNVPMEPAEKPERLFRKWRLVNKRADVLEIRCKRDESFLPRRACGERVG